MKPFYYILGDWKTSCLISDATEFRNTKIVLNREMQSNRYISLSVIFSMVIRGLLFITPQIKCQIIIINARKSPNFAVWFVNHFAIDKNTFLVKVIESPIQINILHIFCGTPNTPFLNSYNIT